MSLDASTDIAATGTNVLSITNSGTGNSFRVNDQASDTTPFVVDASGQVGIGTTTPARPLHVAGTDGMRLAPSALPGTPGAGDIAIDSGASNTLKYYNGSAWVSAGGAGASSIDILSDAIADTTNLFLGTGAGVNNIAFIPLGFGLRNTAVGIRALYSNYYGSDNTASGFEALYSNNSFGWANTASGAQALYSNTDGTQNTASGYRTLYSNTTGNANTASGESALYSNTTGTGNTASGWDALYLNTTGNYNTASGDSALYYNTGIENTASGWRALLRNTTGSQNTAIGSVAGAYLADGTTYNATSADSVFLGAYSKANGAGETNQIVIGYNATGAGSNSVTLGNSSITKTVLQGNVGIGTTTPTTGTRLDIVGTGAAASSIIIPRDTTGNRPITGVNGMLRYNTSNNKFEAYENGAWANMISAGGGALSSLTAATGTNTIDNLLNAQTWNWSTATTQTPMTMTANAITTGSILSLTTSNATVNSTNGLLNVANTGASTSGMVARIQSNSTAGSGLTVLANGNVGIGTTVPGTILDTAGAITSRPSGTGTGQTGQLILRELASGGTDTATLRAPDAIATSYSLTLPTTAGSTGQVLQTDGTGILSWVTAAATVADDSLNFDKFADTMSLDASTDIAATGTNVLSITNSGTGDSFRVNDQASDTSPFVIDASGNVGIGTTVPGTLLDVVNGTARFSITDSSAISSPAGGGANTLILKNSDATAGNTTALKFYNSNNTVMTAIETINTTQTASSEDAALTFTTVGSGTRDERLRIAPSGNVGIGTNSPQAILDLNGTTSNNSSLIVPRANLAARPTNPVNGMIRYNTSSGKFEAYESGAWTNMISNGGGNTPSAFSFIDQTGVAVSSLVTSNTVTLAGGFTGPLTATCIGCAAIARNGSWGSTVVTGFTSGDTIALRLYSAPASSPNQTVTANVTVGATVSAAWQVTSIIAGPDAFAFTDESSALPGITYTSNTVTLTGFAGPLTATCSGDCFSMARNGVWGGTTVTGFVNGDTIALRVNSSSLSAGVKTTSVSIGSTTSAPWTVTAQSNTCGVPLVVGTTCTDGTIYAGISPDGDVPMYTTKCDSDQYWNGSACVTCASGQWSGSGTTCNTTWTRSWGNGTTSTYTGYSSYVTGEANTAGLAALTTGGPYNAASYCENLTAYGSSDWYLPALAELIVLNGNYPTIGQFRSVVYLSSTDHSYAWAWTFPFYSSSSSTSSKTDQSNVYIRCVRR